MKILDRLPLLPQSRGILFGRREVRFHRGAVVVWLSISLRGEVDPSRISEPVPALLDSGNNCEAYLHERHLTEWARFDPALLPVLGSRSINGVPVSLHEAHLWLHPNKPGSLERSVSSTPFRLRLEDGLAISQSQARPTHPATPRVPLLGLTALANNGLDFWFDSTASHCYLRTAGVRSRILRLLNRWA